MTREGEVAALGLALDAAMRHGVRVSRLARLLLDASDIEGRNDETPRDSAGRLVVRRPYDVDWRARALAWLSQQPARTATAREYAQGADLRRATAYARLMALVEDGLAEQVGPGQFRAL